MASNNEKQHRASFGKKPVKQNNAVTMTLKVPCDSAILHSYMERVQPLTLAMFERLGSLKRMLVKDRPLTEMVTKWQSTNMQIAYEQLEEIRIRRETVVLTGAPDVPQINVPESYGFTFEASHPIVHDMVNLVKAINHELKENEALYFAGVIDDVYFERLKTQTVYTLSGVTDRIAKATSPGKRKEGGKYAPELLVKHIRGGYRLDFADVPSSFLALVEEYEAETAAMKTLVNRTPLPEKVEEKVEEKITTKAKSKAKVKAA
ncbi:hypothetical protein [Alteromonas gilva]|uniref:Uncharacterized protein n=1 Tax=Alteromonas gilva TaxID=2987522 RepID=A0ABT5L8L8_9ALTE|nr:hypothetical protein [Alteromonas gilva]MDC8832854.1 hypothetical protein [Alteromonas gilva]